MNGTRLCNLLTAASAHAEITASFRLIGASYSLTLSAVVVIVGFNVHFIDSSLVFRYNKFFSIAVQAFVDSGMTDFQGIFDVKKLT